MTDQAEPSPSLTSQAVWLMAAKTISFAFAVALPLLLVRRLSQQDLGLYKQAFFVVITGMNLLPVGFAMSAFYFLPREPTRQPAVIANILAFMGTMGGLAAVLLLVWPGFLVWLFGTPELAGLARLLGIVVLLWTIGSFLEFITVAVQDVRASTAFIVLAQFSKTGLLMGAAAIFGTVRALVIAALFQGVVQITVMVLYLRRRFPQFWRSFDWPLLRRQGAYALPLGLSSMVILLQDTLHHLFVSHAFGPAGYAIYSVGVTQLPLVGILRESAGAVMLPRINKLESENGRLEILDLVARAARKLALVYFPLSAFLLVVGREVVVFLFTRQYEASWPIFAIAVMILPMNAIVLDPATRAHSERFFFLRLRLAVLGVLTTVLALYASQLGLVGVMASVFIAIASIWLVGVWRMWRLLQVGPTELRAFAPIGWIAVSTVAGASVAAVVRMFVVGRPGWQVIATCAAAFGVVYASGLHLSGVLATAELRSLWQDVRSVSAGLGAIGAGLRRRPRPQAPSDPTAPTPVDLAAR
ncbi:MAG: oligosaccharide flippase family protein [Vicinamibacteraceae bacterium]